MTNTVNTPEASFELLREVLSAEPAISEAYDTTRPEFETHVDLVEQVVYTNDICLAGLDRQIREGELPGGLATRVAIKVLQGRQDASQMQDILTERDTELVVTVVQPMFREAPRIRPRDEHNPAGENALAYKLSLLHGLQAQFPRIRPRLLAVDDGCDGRGYEKHKSGTVAQGIIDEWQLAHPGSGLEARVVFLEDEIRNGSTLVPRGLTTITESVKGGSVLLGMAYATEAWKPEGTPEHVIVDSDADVSTHPAQIPSLILPIVERDRLMTAGSRREEESVSLIGASRNGRGKLFIDVWQKLLPDLAQSVSDTNRGFKAVSADFVPVLLGTVQERKFPYQVEALLVAALMGPEKLEAVPVSYIDSEALSTQAGDGAVQSYLDQVSTLLGIAERYAQKYHQDLGQLIRTLVQQDETGQRLWAEAEARCTSVDELLIFAKTRNIL